MSELANAIAEKLTFRGRMRKRWTRRLAEKRLKGHVVSEAGSAHGDLAAFDTGYPEGKRISGSQICSNWSWRAEEKRSGSDPLNVRH